MNYKRFWNKTGEGGLEVKVQHRWETVTGDLDADVSGLGTNPWKRKTASLTEYPYPPKWSKELID